MNKEELLELLKKKEFREEIKEIISAFSKVKREDFAPKQLRDYVYEDIPLPLESGAAISQPSTIAFILTLLNLQKCQKILEIGSGSGYMLSLISNIIKEGEIYGIEIKDSLAIKAKKLLLQDKKIHILIKDGLSGLKSKAPFDRILISAAAQTEETIIPLISQLKDTGILVAPIKDSLIQFIKSSGLVEKHEFPGFAFVPLVGNHREEPHSNL